MKTFRSVLFVLATAVLLSSPLTAAGTLPDVDLTPLLRVHSTLLFRFLPDPSVGDLLEDGDLFVSQGGATTWVRLLRREGESFRTETFIGAGRADFLRQLKGRLGSNRAGFLEDCAIVDPEAATTGTYEVTWYGRGGRRNSFTFTLTGDAGALPVCSPDAELLFETIFGYANGLV